MTKERRGPGRHCIVLTTEEIQVIRDALRTAPGYLVKGTSVTEEFRLGHRFTRLAERFLKMEEE